MKLKIIFFAILLNFKAYSAINISINEFIKNYNQKPKTINANFRFEENSDNINSKINFNNIKKITTLVAIILFSYTGYKIYSNKSNNKVIKNNINPEK